MGLIRMIYPGILRILSFLRAPRLSAHELSLHPNGEYISDWIRERNSHYELENLLKVSMLCNFKKFVDVGANIGNHSNFFSQLGASGYAFEPSKANFELLEKNVPSFITLQTALGSKRGSLIYEHSLNQWGTTVYSQAVL